LLFESVGPTETYLVQVEQREGVVLLFIFFAFVIRP
jgi:hypothetical protein